MANFLDPSALSASSAILLCGLPVITFLALIENHTENLTAVSSKLFMAGIWCLLITNTLYSYNSFLNSILNTSLIAMIIFHCALCLYFKEAIKQKHHHVFEGFIVTLIFGPTHIYQWEKYEKAQNEQQLLSE